MRLSNQSLEGCVRIAEENLVRGMGGGFTDSLVLDLMDARAVISKIHSMAVNADIRGKYVPTDFILEAIEKAKV